MTSEEILHATLLGSTEVSAIVGTRIWPDESPQKAVLPFIIYARANTDFVTVVSKSDPIGESVEFEIQCLASKRSEADALAKLVRKAIGDAKFSTVSQNSEKQTDLDKDVEVSILGAQYWHTFT